MTRRAACCSSASSRWSTRATSSRRPTGTFELLVREAVQPSRHFFDVDRYEVSTRSTAPGISETTATVVLRGQDGVHAATAMGHGPFNALHVCLRKCLAQLYPQISDVRLTDYKVRVLDSHKGTAAKVRVLIEWSDHRASWSPSACRTTSSRRAGRRSSMPFVSS